MSLFLFFFRPLGSFRTHSRATVGLLHLFLFVVSLFVFFLFLSVYMYKLAYSYFGIVFLFCFFVIIFFLPFLIIYHALSSFFLIEFWYFFFSFLGKRSLGRRGSETQSGTHSSRGEELRIRAYACALIWLLTPFSHIHFDQLLHTHTQNAYAQHKRVCVCLCAFAYSLPV